MRINTILVPLFIGTVFLSACKSNSVSLQYTNAKGEVPQLGNLVFRFNHSLVKDSMLNAWDSSEYVSFEPAIPGRFRWESPDQLVFSPSRPLNPATTYKVKIRKEILRHSKYDVIKNADKLDFHTPGLTLENSQVIWMQDENNGAIPQVDLFFNYRINPNDLKEKLKVDVDGNKMEYKMLTASADNKISFQLVGIVKKEDKNYDTRVTIEKGLKPEEGSNATSEHLVSNFSIPSPFALTIQNVETSHDGTEGTITGRNDHCDNESTAHRRKLIVFCQF
jgi:alpha-2-macroglobulin